MIRSEEHVSALIVSSSDKIFDFFKELISDTYSSDIIRASSVGEAKRLSVSDTFDIVIINAPLKDETGIEFALDLAADTDTGVLILINNEYYEQVSYEAGRYGVFTLSKPTSRQTSEDALRFMTVSNARLGKYQQRAAKLNAKIEEIRIVNHAKWELIEKLGITEKEAHKLIEKQAMDTRRTRREVAETILKTYK